jgi:hypothetical protein
MPWFDDPKRLAPPRILREEQTDDRHPLAASRGRLTITVARQLQEIGTRCGIASACVGAGQSMAVLIDNQGA